MYAQTGRNLKDILGRRFAEVARGQTKNARAAIG